MASNFDLLASSFSKFVVSPLNAFGLGGFVFDIEDETSINLQADITDNFLEDGTTVQDNISIRPKRLTLRRYVGELVYSPENNKAASIAQKVTQKLTTLGSFLPALSTATSQAKGLIEDARSGSLSLDSISFESINKVVDFWGLAQNLVGISNSKQAQAYAYLSALWENKILVSVQTPFEFMSNMAIERVDFYQLGESDSYSDISITLKQIRTVQLLTDVSGVQDAVSSIESEPLAAAPGYPTAAPKTVSPVASAQRAPLKTVGNIQGLKPGPRLTEAQLPNLSNFNYNVPPISEADLR